MKNLTLLILLIDIILLILALCTTGIESIIYYMLGFLLSAIRYAIPDKLDVL